MEMHKPGRVELGEALTRARPRAAFLRTPIKPTSLLVSNGLTKAEAWNRVKVGQSCGSHTSASKGPRWVT